MKPVVRVRSVVPDWAIVVAVVGVVGALSAILSIAVYREALGSGETAIPVESVAG